MDIYKQRKAEATAKEKGVSHRPHVLNFIVVTVFVYFDENFQLVKTSSRLPSKDAGS